MKRAMAAILLTLAAAAESGAFLWWRDNVAGEWTDKTSAVLLEGGSEWETPLALEEPGLLFRALNDSSNLYIQVMADNREGRALLLGSFRQDVTFWFLRPDGKKRAWGFRLPFSRIEATAAELADALRFESGIPARSLPDPEFIPVEGGTALPQGRDLSFRADFTGREPVYFLRVSLAALGANGAKTIPLDFVSSAPAEPFLSRAKALQAAVLEERRKEPLKQPAEGGVHFQTDVITAFAQPGSPGMPSPKRLQKGGTKAQAPPRVRVPMVPEPVEFPLSFRLARKAG